MADKIYCKSHVNTNTPLCSQLPASHFAHQVKWQPQFEEVNYVKLYVHQQNHRV